MGMTVGMSVTGQVHIVKVQLHLLLSVKKIHTLLVLYFVQPPIFWENVKLE